MSTYYAYCTANFGSNDFPIDFDPRLKPVGARSPGLARAVHFALPETRAGGLEGGEQVVMRKGFVSRITSPSQDSLHMAGPFALVL